jgi:hypothetical protein
VVGCGMWEGGGEGAIDGAARSSQLT